MKEDGFPRKPKNAFYEMTRTKKWRRSRKSKFHIPQRIYIRIFGKSGKYYITTTCAISACATEEDEGGVEGRRRAPEVAAGEEMVLLLMLASVHNKFQTRYRGFAPTMAAIKESFIGHHHGDVALLHQHPAGGRRVSIVLLLLFLSRGV